MLRVDFICFVQDKLLLEEDTSMSGGLGMSEGIVAVTSLALEARIALGPGVSVICSQGECLAAALESAAKRGASGIISFGVAGGLAPDLIAGDWIAAAAVRTGQRLFPTDQAWTRSLVERLPEAAQAEIVGMDTLVADPLEKRLLHAQTGAAAVDMESHIAARIAAAHQIPFVACRAIIDPADKPLPPAALIGLRPDGTADVLAVFRSVVRQPANCRLSCALRSMRGPPARRCAAVGGCWVRDWAFPISAMVCSISAYRGAKNRVIRAPSRKGASPQAVAHRLPISPLQGESCTASNREGCAPHQRLHMHLGQISVCLLEETAKMAYSADPPPCWSCWPVHPRDFAAIWTSGSAERTRLDRADLSPAATP